jgi:hypothetical protein
MPDLDFQQLSTVQNANQPKPVTIASATTIAPTTFLTYISGTAAIATVTPPVTGCHMLLLWPLGAFTMTTAGNLNAALTAAANSPVMLIYDPALGKYRACEIPAAA